MRLLEYNFKVKNVLSFPFDVEAWSTNAIQRNLYN